ncbi:hypothetical protein GQ43DRAFT_489739, partial [Delitschia confertaspora ATCC 74209]
ALPFCQTQPSLTNLQNTGGGALFSESALSERGGPGMWSYDNMGGLGLIQYMNWRQGFERELISCRAWLYPGKTIVPQSVLVDGAMNELDFLAWSVKPERSTTTIILITANPPITLRLPHVLKQPFDLNSHKCQADTLWPCWAMSTQRSSLWPSFQLGEFTTPIKLSVLKVIFNLLNTYDHSIAVGDHVRILTVVGEYRASRLISRTQAPNWSVSIAVGDYIRILTVLRESVKDEGTMNA